MNEQDEKQRMSLVRVLCEWALTPHRKDNFRFFIVAILLKRIHSELCTMENSKFPLQQALLTLLDNSKNFTSTNGTFSSCDFLKKVLTCSFPPHFVFFVMHYL
jgi:hypothetical protein